MKIIFFGSSEFSLAALQACRNVRYEVLLAITTPDQKKGRGLKVTPTPVRLFCEEKGIPCEAPYSLRPEDIFCRVVELRPDYFVVSSYGKMIPSAWLKIPARLSLNVHPSLLPKYRGAAPVQWAILNGEMETGVSIADVTDQLDSGDIFHQVKIALEEDWDAEFLMLHLAELSGRALAECFEKDAGNKLHRQPQEDTTSSYARKLTKEDGLIHWTESSSRIYNQIRGLLPWPVAYMPCQDVTVQILRAKKVSASLAQGRPGQILAVDANGGLEIQTGSGAINLEIVRPQGKREMRGADFARGRYLKPGDSLVMP